MEHVFVLEWSCWSEKERERQERGVKRTLDADAVNKVT